MTQRGNGNRGLSENPPNSADREAAQQAQIVARRAIRRLDMLEWVIFAVGAGLAAGGGALIAWMLSELAGWDFRSTWIGASLLLFVVPGAMSIAQIRRDERDDASGTGGQQESDDG
jgi:uncharacterized membrane protein